MTDQLSTISQLSTSALLADGPSPDVAPALTPLVFDFLNPDYRAVIVERNERLAKIRSDARLLAAAIMVYREDPAQFIEDWGVTYDPRQTPQTMPFRLWKRQREYLAWLKERVDRREDGLVEKSRDAGATWLNCAFAVWALLFRHGSKISFGSRKEKLVDELGNPDSIFEKIRMILRWLPAELLPVGFNVDVHAPYMKIVNPETGATITGEAGDNIGRGGRSTLYFKDESAFYERPDRIDAALSQNSDVKIDVSTPNGPGNPFYRKRFSGKIPVFVFDWRDDPRKTEAWYQKQKDTLEPWIVAQEIDRDYHASIEGICIPSAWVKAAVGLKLPAVGARYGGLDVADEGGDANALAIRKGVVVESVESWKDGNTTQTARKAWRLCLDAAADVLCYDSIGVGAGVKGELASIAAGDSVAEHGESSLHVRGINSGNTDLSGLYAPGKSNADMFLNLRAQMWWTLRRRFERTWEHVNGVRQWDVDELISLPPDPELETELSMPLWDVTETGRIRIESKKQMRKRGVKSPNLADALMLAFAPESHVQYGQFGGRAGRGAV